MAVLYGAVHAMHLGRHLRGRGRMNEGADGDVVGFAERLLAVIDEGRRTATYKLAVLLALMDCCAEGVSERGEAPSELSTRTIARKVAAIYWPQLRPFPAPLGAVELRQITNKNATVLSVLRRVFEDIPAVPSWEAAEAVVEPSRVAEALDVVELTVARYPLVRLQTIDGVSLPFLYDIHWDERVSIPRLRTGATVRMRPGAGDQLLRLAPLIRPLIELHWVRMVAGLNGLAVAEDDLRTHLFGAHRVSFPQSLRQQLAQLQEGGCFYCPESLTASSAVDHFIPWSRWPNDAVENLVMAHPSCNSHKSDRLPGRIPLGQWASRIRSQADDLARVASHSGWRSDRPRSTSLARSLYAHLPPGAAVWEGPRRLSLADPVQLVDLLVDL